MDNQENNKLIAEFMGLEKFEFKSINPAYDRQAEKMGLTKGEHYLVLGKHLSTEQLPYSESWDWLMTVVGKIRTIPSYDCDKFGTDVTINGDKTTIKSGCYGNRKHGDYFFNKTFRGKFNTTEATYKSVVEFINHYNRKPIK